MSYHKFLNEYVFDGQLILQCDKDTIINKYVESVERGERNPVILQHNSSEIYFSWVDQPWDSEKLGINVNRIDFISYICDSAGKISEIISYLSGTDLIYLRLSINHQLVGMLKHFDVGLVEYGEKIMFGLTFKDEYEEEPPVGINNFSELRIADKFDQVILISEQAFKQNRFYRDPRFPERFFSLVYRSWLEKFISGSGSILCFVEGDRIRGFLAYSRNIENHNCLRYGFIDLIAVDRDCQHKSIATKLISAIRNELINDGIGFLYANTDSTNQGAINLFHRTGFRQFNVLKEYHYWKN